MEVSFWRLSARGVHQWFRAPGSTRLPGPGPFSMAVGGQRRRGGQDRTECLWVWPGHPRNPSPAPQFLCSDPQPPAPQCDILRRQGSGEVAKVERGHSGGSSSSPTGVLNEKRGSGGRLAEGRPRERMGRWGGRHPHTEQRGRRRNRPRSRLDLGLPASWAVGRCCSVTEAPGHGTLSGPPAGPTFIPGDRSPAVDVSGSCPMGFVL